MTQPLVSSRDIALLDERIKNVTKRMDELKNELRTHTAVLRQMSLGRLKMVLGVEVGSVVYDHKGEFKIARIEEIRDPLELDHLSTGCQRPWLQGFRKNKDGSWCKVLHTCYGRWDIKPFPPRDMKALSKKIMETP